MGFGFRVQGLGCRVEARASHGRGERAPPAVPEESQRFGLQVLLVLLHRSEDSAHVGAIGLAFEPLVR